MIEKSSYFARRLKELRTDAGITQAALADKTGISLSAIRQFEYGRREPTYGTLVKLAKGLKLSLAAFEQDAVDELHDASTSHSRKHK